MNRFTIPDEPIEGGTRRRVIDTRAVRQEAMTIYWLLKEYEDTGMEPEEDMDELDMLRSENEELRMRLAEIRERVNGMELPHEYHILYTRGWHDAVEEVRRYID